MLHISKLFSLLGMLMSMAFFVGASPLLPRVTTFVDCTAAQKTKLTTALANAAALAGIAATINTTSTAFTHYFRAADAAGAIAMWNAVAANNNPANTRYSFSLRCAKSCTGAASSSLAITNAAPQAGTTPREMTICPLFFTAAQTKLDLNSKKYNGTARGSWCVLGQKFAAFETAGHTILHEMTHLDALGIAAGAPAYTDATGFTTHGTDDVVGYGADYVAAARAFAHAWQNPVPGNPAANAIRPWQNAENLAASATEWWFIKSCGFAFTDIPL